MTADLLAGIAGVVLSLFFSYVPKLNTKFAGLDDTYKRLIMLGALVLVSGAVYGLACAGWAGDLGIGVTCDKAGGIELVKAFFVALIANQSAFAISPRTEKVEAAKA